MQKVSRRAWGLRLRRTVPGLALASRMHVAFRCSDGVGVLIAAFRSSIPSPPIPLVYASLHASRRAAQNSGPSGSLLLSPKDLSSSPSCRFIPALSGPPPSRSTALTLQESEIASADACRAGLGTRGWGRTVPMHRDATLAVGNLASFRRLSRFGGQRGRFGKLDFNFELYPVNRSEVFGGA